MNEIVAEEEMLAEYDFSQGQRGKHSHLVNQPYRVVIQKEDGTTEIRETLPSHIVSLDADVQAYFSNSEAVNHALRTLISLFPEKV